MSKVCVVMKRNIPAVPADCDVISFKYFNGNTGCIFFLFHEHDDSVRVNVSEI
jgi:hypothetical protein